MSDYKIRVDVGSDYSLAVEAAKINGNLDDLKMKVSSVKKENGKNIVTFSDGKQMVVNDGATPYISEDGYWYIDGKPTGIKARAEHNFNELTPEEKAEIKGEKGDPLRWPDLTQSQKEEIRGPRGYTGPGSKVTNTTYDSDGNTVLTFNDGTKTTVKKGKKGDKGDPGTSVSVSSVTKSGLTSTVKFTDGKNMQVQDGKSVTVSSSRFLTNGDTEVSFSDGSKAVIKKGVDGTVSFDKLTEEQRKSLMVPVVDDLTTGGSDKALSAEQGKILFNHISHYHPWVRPKVMTAVIDQSNPNPLTCVSYEDDAKMMEEGSSEWDDFFQSQLVLFKNGKEVRELKDSELNSLSSSDGDVMVRFPRKGLRIKTVGEKVYVSMTNKVDDPDFEYLAHSRGIDSRDNFYVGAYLGYEENGKLRSVSGKEPLYGQPISYSRSIAQANGDGYGIMAFYQWTFLQAMYVLKYRNLNDKEVFGNTVDTDITLKTGVLNGKGIDVIKENSQKHMRFQWIENMLGSASLWCDGVRQSDDHKKIYTTNQNFTTNFQALNEFYIPSIRRNIIFIPRKIIGNSQSGFIAKLSEGTSTTGYCNYNFFGDADKADANYVRIGGNKYNEFSNKNNGGIFTFDMGYTSEDKSTGVGSILIYI